MSVTKRPNGSYQVTVCYGGRTLRKTSRHWTYQDAKQYERRWLASVRDAAAGREAEYGLAEGMERWLTEHVCKLRSREKTENHAKQVLPFIVGRKLNEAPQVWAEIKAAYADRANATINHKGRVLRQICNLAFSEWGWTRDPIGKRIKLLPERPRETFLTAAQVQALAKACPDPSAGDLVRLAAYTGIRRGHLMRLVARDHYDGEYLHLDRTSKNQKLQLVPVHPRVAEIAQRLPLPITDRELTKSWGEARKACKMPGVRFHDLRHTCASWLVQAGVPLLTVSEFLGHSSVAVTRRYAHLAPVNLRDAILKIA